MLMSTYERLGEYATLRAVGASRRVIGLTIIYEAIFLNVTGGLLGLIFGYLATGVLDKAVAILLEIPYPMAGVTPGLLLQALALSFGVGLVGSIIPIFIVSRIDLVAQLRKGM
jgi:putative ABC transport system permease protein